MCKRKREMRKRQTDKRKEGREKRKRKEGRRDRKKKMHEACQELCQVSGF